jgi:hypothetical protein
MSENTRANKNHLRLADIVIIILCLSIMAYSLYLFRNDLYQTIRLQNVQPVGTITIKSNVVQRRIADRVLWDRLRVESPVYLGDIIRVAELSAATLNIEDQQIDIEENTLIRIQLSPDGSGALQIELTDGSLGVKTGAQGGGLQLNLMGRVIETGAGTVLSAAAGKNGIALQVNEGKAVFIEEGANREISSGTMIALNAEGTEQRVLSAVVTQPRPNARYVKNTEPLSVRFAWNRVNLTSQDTLRLEIAADRNFSRVVQSIQNLDTSAEVSLEAGLWNWRLLHENTLLSSGRLTVVETENVNLTSPARGSLFRYSDGQPSLRLEWPEKEEASNYVIEIASTPDFANPQISRQTAAPFFIDSSLTEGTWYWRVKPVFSSAYEGSASFSNVSFFIIEHTDQAAAGEQAVTLLEGAQLRELERVIGNEPPPEPVIALAETPPAAPPPAPPPQAPVAAPVRTAAVPPPQPAPSPSPPPQVQVSPPPAPSPQVAMSPSPEQLLPVPANRIPANNYRIGIEQIKTQRNIVFRWAAVSGANAYILTLYEQAGNGRRQINRVTVTSPAWTLENIDVLGRGTFVWQIEAVSRNSGGAITRRGTTGENTFTVDIPLPRPVQMDDPGVLYGF